MSRQKCQQVRLLGGTCYSVAKSRCLQKTAGDGSVVFVVFSEFDGEFSWKRGNHLGLSKGAVWRSIQASHLRRVRGSLEGRDVHFVTLLTL